MMFPLLISATGILACVLVTLIATDLKPAKQISEIESTLKMQLIISTVLMTPVTLAVALTSLPATFELSVPSHSPDRDFDTKVGPLGGGGRRAGGGGPAATAAAFRNPQLSAQTPRGSRGAVTHSSGCRNRARDCAPRLKP
jgi:hypothetical protein